MAIYNRGTKKKPNYMYRTYVGKDPITGKDKYVSKTGFRTKADAEFAELIIKRQYADGNFIGPNKVLLSDLKKEFLLHYISTGVKTTSVKLRESMLGKFIDDMNNRRAQSITANDYQRYINEMKEKYSKNHIKAMHTSVKMMFQYAVEHSKIISQSPCDNATLPKFNKTVEELEKEDTSYNYLEKDELQQFLNATKTDGLYNDYPLFMLLAYTGIRSGELRALKWADFDSENHTIRISKTLYNNNNRKVYEILTPKTRKSNRTLSIDPLIVDVLKHHKSHQDEVKKNNDLVYHDSNFIFANEDGYPLTIGKISDRIVRLINHTDIKKHVSTHTFRHSHASLLIEAGVHIKEIQERLGHSSITTTMDIYAAVTKDIKQQSSEQFSNLMKSVSEGLEE